MENKVFEEEIDLMRIFEALFRRMWAIVVVAVIFACGTGAYTQFVMQPTYTSTSAMLVLTKETTLTSLADLQIGSQLTKDYTVLIKSRPVLEEVIANLGLDMSYKDLKSQIKIENPEDTRILYISVTMGSAKQAKVVVDELATISSAYIADAMEITAPKIIEDGEVATTKTSPSLTKNTMIGFLVGAFLVCAIIVVLELLDDAVQSEADVERYLELSILAVVPNKVTEQKKKKKKVQKEKSGKAK